MTAARLHRFQSSREWILRFSEKALTNKRNVCYLRDAILDLDLSYGTGFIVYSASEYRSFLQSDDSKLRTESYAHLAEGKNVVFHKNET